MGISKPVDHKTAEVEFEIRKEGLADRAQTKSIETDRRRRIAVAVQIKREETFNGSTQSKEAVLGCSK